MTRLLSLAFFLISPLVWGQGDLWLRNTDAWELVYWTLTPQTTDTALLASLPLAEGGAHRVGPGERVKLVLGAGQELVGVFLPPVTNYLTPLEGSTLTAGDLPSKGTVLLNPRALAAAERRHLRAPLQAWNLVPFVFRVDGDPQEWSGYRALAEWGNGFLPGSRPWAGGPKPQRLQAVEREGGLQLHLTISDGAFPAGTTVSLALRRAGAFLEWPLNAGTTAWSWREGQAASPVGPLAVKGRDLEARVDWNRLEPGEVRAWKTAELTWSLIVTVQGEPLVLDLASTKMDEWE